MIYALYLLQYIPAASNVTIIILFLALFLFLLLIIFSGRSQRKSLSHAAKLSPAELRNLARRHNLKPFQRSWIARAAKELEIKSYSQIFQSTKILDRVLIHIIQSIGNSTMTENKQDNLVGKAFDIKRQIINAKLARGFDRSSSTRQLYPNQPVTIYSQTTQPVQSKIVLNNKSFLAVAIPKDSKGEPLRFRPGTQLKLRVSGKGRYPYTFRTRVRQIKKDEFETMLLEHSSKIDVPKLRKDQRRSARIKALYRKATIVTEGKGKNLRQKLMIEKGVGSGIIEDISRGGASFSTRSRLNNGEFIKLQFTIMPKNTDGNIELIAKVLSAQVSPQGYINRLGFTNVKPEYLNYIQSYVYGFLDH